MVKRSGIWIYDAAGRPSNRSPAGLKIGEGHPPGTLFFNERTGVAYIRRRNMGVQALTSAAAGPAILVASSQASEALKELAWPYVCDGVNDQIPILAALEASEGPVELTAGLFTISACIDYTSTTKSVTFEGQGAGVTILRSGVNDLQPSIVEFNELPALTVRDMTLDGVNFAHLTDPTAGRLLRALGCRNVHIYNVHALDAGAAPIQIAPSFTNRTIDRIRVHDCFVNSPHVGIAVETGGVTCGGEPDFPNAESLIRSVIISDNIIDGGSSAELTTSGIGFGGIQYWQPFGRSEEVIITGNIVKNLSVNGINCGDFDNAGTEGWGRVTITDNIITNVWGYGMLVRGGGANSYLVNLLLTDNIVRKPNMDANGDYAGIEVRRIQKGRVSGNLVDLTDSAVTAIPNIKASTSSDLLIDKNVVRGSTTTPEIELSSSDTPAPVIRDNDGFMAPGEAGVMEGWVADNKKITTLQELPADHIIIGIDVWVQQAFNGSGTDLLTVGISGGDTDAYMDDLDVSATGVKDTSAECAAAVDYGKVIAASGRDLQLIYVDQNSDADEGRAHVTVRYMKATTQVA